MCGGGGGSQTVTQKTELDPVLQRLLYGGVYQGPNPVAPAAPPASNGGSNGGGNDDGGAQNYFDAIAAGAAVGRDMEGSDPGRAGFGGTASDSMAAGGMYAMGGPVRPQMGIASLNQGQMPMMGGQLPNLSDPMTAATLAMAVRNPQMQYGNIMAPPAGFKVGGYVEGPGTGTSDSIDAVIMQNGRPVQEALLSDGEFVMTERAVRGAGGGDREKGAARMYEMMRQFERGGRV
jgi:hypothetical protein